MQPFVGQITLFAFPRVPVGWHLCDGSLLSIADYEVLFTLIGTTYGGNGSTNFAVPDLRGRVPIHQGQGGGLTMRVIGQPGGTETVTLQLANLPAHSHALTANGTNPATAAVATPGPTLQFGVAGNGASPYVLGTVGATSLVMDASSIGIAPGGNQPHGNMMPTTIANYCIAWAGIFPSQG